MDSLTQIVLGAAVGEVVLGKKLGNRAMVWGGIAGTIPDLDVLSSPFLNDMQRLVAHRGITHSILFTLLASPVFAWLVMQLYERGWHQKKGLRWAWAIFMGFIFGAIGFFILNITWASKPTFAVFASLVGIGGFFLYRNLFRYLRKAPEPAPTASLKEWTIFFFLGIFTHWMLDAFTAYGTQMFVPFDYTRVAFNNIAVADPAYTFPFLICLLIASTYTRGSRSRQMWNWLGIGISSLYMLWTINNKINVDAIVKQNIMAQNISYKRYMSAPTILNNVLWTATVESDSSYYIGYYSLLDKTQNINFIEIPAKHELLDNAPYRDSKDVAIAKWFAKGYYSVVKRPLTKIEDFPNKKLHAEMKKAKVLPEYWLQINDMRYGVYIGTNPADSMPQYIFNLHAIELNGKVQVVEGTRGPDDRDKFMQQFWARIKGI
jgi:inner membrane protein